MPTESRIVQFNADPSKVPFFSLSTSTPAKGCVELVISKKLLLPFSRSFVRLEKLVPHPVPVAATTLEFESGV